MTTTDTTKTAAAPFARDLLHTVRQYLDGRRGLVILAIVALVGGAGFNWSWLVAFGVAPLLLSVLPCLVMCGFGLCMSRLFGVAGASRDSKAPGSEMADGPSAQATIGGPSVQPSCCRGDSRASPANAPAEPSNAR